MKNKQTYVDLVYSMFNICFLKKAISFIDN